MITFNTRLERVLAAITESIDNAILAKLRSLIRVPQSKYRYHVECELADLPPETEVPDEVEAVIRIDAKPTGSDPTGLAEIEGPITAYVAVRTQANGITAYVQTLHYAGDEDILGEDGNLVPTTFSGVANAINDRFQDWATGVDEAHADPEHIRTMMQHFDLTHEFKDQVRRGMEDEEDEEGEDWKRRA